MSHTAKLLSISMLSGCVLIAGGYAAGQQTAASQSRAVPAAKSRTAQSVPGPTDKVSDQLAQMQEQFKQLQDTVEVMRSEQQLMKASVEGAVRLAGQSNQDLAEITNSLARDAKTVGVVGNGIVAVGDGVGILLGRTNNLESDLRQIKTRLGLPHPSQNGPR